MDILSPVSGNGKAEVLAAARTLRGGTFIGVGTFIGDFTEELCRECQPARFYCVDPYVSYPEFQDALNIQDLAAIREQAHQRLAPIPGLSFIRAFSVDEATLFNDGTVDFIYIDGNHACKFVLQDLEVWFPKLRHGGLMAGDDAHDLETYERDEAGDCEIVWRQDGTNQAISWGRYGVRNAVRQFARTRPDIRVEWPGWQFLFWKP